MSKKAESLEEVNSDVIPVTGAEELGFIIQKLLPLSHDDRSRIVNSVAKFFDLEFTE